MSTGLSVTTFQVASVKLWSSDNGPAIDKSTVTVIQPGASVVIPIDVVRLVAQAMTANGGSYTSAALGTTISVSVAGGTVTISAGGASVSFPSAEASKASMMLLVRGLLAEGIEAYTDPSGNVRS